MKKLHATFLNSEGKKHTFSPKVFDGDLTEFQVRNAMDKMVDLDIVDRDGISYFEVPESAKYVETIETKIF